MSDTLSASDVAMLSNGNEWGGNSFMWIFALLILAGGGFGGFGGYNAQYDTQDFVQNGFNFNDLQDQNRDILNSITMGTAQSVAAVKDAQAALTAQLSDVRSMEQNIIGQQMECCGNILRGIDSVNYNNAMNTAAINANTTAQTQKILDAIAGNRMADMQNQINQLQLQNAVAGVVRYPNASTYFAGVNPFCCCSNTTSSTGGTGA